MKQVSELKPGEIVYKTDYRGVSYYTYFGVHPHNKKYHVLIDQFQDPVRMYEPELQAILDQRLTSYDIALGALADRMELQAKEIRGQLLMRKNNYEIL